MSTQHYRNPQPEVGCAYVMLLVALVLGIALGWLLLAVLQVVLGW